MDQETPPTQFVDAEIDLGAILRVVWRRRWILLGVLGMALLFGAVATIAAQRVYKAKAKILIDRAAPEVLGELKEVYDLGTGSYWNTQQYYATQYDIIKARPVAEKAAARLGLSAPTLKMEIEQAGPASMEAKVAGDPLHGLDEPVREKLQLLGLDGVKDREQLVETLTNLDVPDLIGSKVGVEPIKDSQLVYITVTDTDPARAATLANAVRDAYLEFNIEQKVDLTDNAAGWLGDQMLELNQKLDSSEQVLYAFKRENNIVDVSMEDRQTMISETLSQLNRSLSETKAKRLGLGSRRARINEVRSDGSDLDRFSEVIGHPHIQKLKATHSELTQEGRDLSFRYTEEHEKMKALREKLNGVKQEIDHEVDKILISIDEDYRVAVDTERRLKGAIEEAKTEALRLNEKEGDYKRLTRELDNNQALYDLVLKRQKEADLTRLLKVNNVRKIEDARPPDIPISPRSKLNMLLAFVLGLLAGIGAAFLFDYLDNTVKTQTQIEQQIGLPFLGILPAIEGEKHVKLVEIGERDHYIIQHPRSSVAECCRTIRTNLLFMSPDKPARILLVTSAGPREGKSTTAINLGITMAQAGARVVLVDTDMRRPRLHKTFSVENDLGISNLILGGVSIDQVVRPSGIERLDIVTCGPIPPNPAELLHTDSFRNILSDLTARYDRVLFDSPPVAAVTDALVLSSMVEGVVLVVQAGKTTWPAALRSKRQLEDVGAQVFGVVLNSVDLRDNRYGDYNYYYYRSGYAYGYGEEPPEKKKKRSTG